MTVRQAFLSCLPLILLTKLDVLTVSVTHVSVTLRGTAYLVIKVLCSGYIRQSSRHRTAVADIYAMLSDVNPHYLYLYRTALVNDALLSLRIVILLNLDYIKDSIG